MTEQALRFTSISDEALPWLVRGLNVRTSVLVVGAASDPSAPAVAIVDVHPGPGDRLRTRHVHDTDAVNLVIAGSMYMDGEWLRPGQAKVVPAGTEYGDALEGPEGVTFLEIFASWGNAMPRYGDPEDHAYYESVHGTALRGGAVLEM
jgi:hypothetical protein